MNFLFLFLDGVGLGADDPRTNPLAAAPMPHLQGLLGDRKLLLDSIPDQARRLETRRASLLALDACLGVEGLPQSATGQAVLLTGKNVPKAIGCHYGPKPNPSVAVHLQNGNLFAAFHKMGLHTSFLNAYPPRYFEAIRSGRRMYSAIPLAATSAGLRLKTAEDLSAGQALSADFTGQGWRTQLGLADAPLYTPVQAGVKLAKLAGEVEFSFFEYWLSDYAGHHQDMSAALQLLQTFDQVLAGLLSTWDDAQGLILITSDHGNLEDLSTRRHTANPVPALIIGAPELRQRFAASLVDLTGIAPAIRALFTS